jgi:hypothetical protein
MMAFFFASALWAAHPVPLITQPLRPAAVHPGSAAFTLHVLGDGFLKSTVINWNGVPLATTFLTSREVTAMVPAANVASPGTASITAVNPAPKGGASNTLYLSIVRPQVTTAMTASAVRPANTQPVSIVTGDFNRDGKLDIITGNIDFGGISVLLNNEFLVSDRLCGTRVVSRR